MTSFADLTKQVHLIDDLILSDMKCGRKDSYSEEELEFSKHVLSCKFLYGRISAANKKRFLLSLLRSLKSVWALSLILKSIWNCRPKDAVMSASEPKAWSSYDETPMDSNRTAQPITTLAEVMINERKWILSLEPEPQAFVISELLTLSGGPILWDCLSCAQNIYENHTKIKLQTLEDCVVVNKPSDEKPKANVTDQAHKKHISRPKTSLQDIHDQSPNSATPQKELEVNLAEWNAAMKSMRDSMKLEEFDVTYKDGTHSKMWRVNRPKPESIEAVDLISLLPSTISKRIFMCLPLNQLSDYARVNKYWAFVIDELKAEIAARQKINIEIEKIREKVLSHDLGTGESSKSDHTGVTSSEVSTLKITKKEPFTSVTLSPKSAAISFKQMVARDAKTRKIIPRPIRNMADLCERLDRRGAADENIWRWCNNVLKLYKRTATAGDTLIRAGLLNFGTIHFPCPMLAYSLPLPLDPPLTENPTKLLPPKKHSSNVTHTAGEFEPFELKRRYNLRTKDFSNLLPITKISSYQMV